MTLTPCSSACRCASTPGKRRQQRRMNVEDGVGERVEQRRADEPHEAGEADEPTAARAAARRDSARSKSSREASARWSSTTVSMPAAAARARPAAAGRFEITTAIRASSRPSAMASMSAWRLLPRPEISTPIGGRPSSGFGGEPHVPHHSRYRTPRSPRSIAPTMAALSPASREILHDPLGIFRRRPR